MLILHGLCNVRLALKTQLVQRNNLVIAVKHNDLCSPVSGLVPSLHFMKIVEKSVLSMAETKYVLMMCFRKVSLEITPGKILLLAQVDRHQVKR